MQLGRALSKNTIFVCVDRPEKEEFVASVVERYALSSMCVEHSCRRVGRYHSRSLDIVIIDKDFMSIEPTDAAWLEV